MRIISSFLFALACSVAMAAPSSSRQLTGSTIKNGSATITLPTTTGTLCGIAETCELTNKTMDGATNVLTNFNVSILSAGTLGYARGGTGQSSWAEGDLLYASAANTLSKLTIGASTYVLTSNGSTPYWALSSGGGTGLNYLSNGTAETGTTGWATYADAAATSPVNGTAGSPTVTWTQYTNFFPLLGTYSFLLTKDAANRQGEGASYDFSTGIANKSQVQKVEFDYIVESGTFAAGSPSTTGDVTVWAYDVTNSQLIELSSYKLFASSTSVPGHFSGYFQTASNSTNYRLIFHVASTSASAFVLKIDNIQVGPSQYVYGTPITDWQSFTPSNGSWTANSPVYTGMFRRVGDTMEMMQKVTAGGAVTNTALTMNLPTGYVIDASKLVTSVSGYGAIQGECITVDFGASAYPCNVVYNSTTSVTVYLYGASGTYSNSQNFSATVPFTFAANDYVEIKVRVPIAGWSSSVQMSDNADMREMSFGSYRTGAQTGINPNNSAVKIAFDTVESDSHGAFSTSNNRFTAPTAGVYDFSAGMGIAATNVLANNYYLLFYKNGTQYKTAAYKLASAGVGFYLNGAITSLKLNAGDYVEVFIFGAGNNSASTIGTTANGITDNYFSGYRHGGPTAIGATELVAMRYVNTAGTSIPNTADNVVPFATKDYDTHGIFVTDTATIPAAGKYRINCNLNFSSSLYAISNAVAASIYKNGSAVAYGPYQIMGGAPTGSVGISVSTMLNLVAGDAIVCRATNTRSAGATTLDSATGKNFFELQRVGL